ncbi:structural protein, partial [Salmonella enterica]
MKLLQAIIRHENGEQPYGFDVFVRALDLAGG